MLLTVDQARTHFSRGAGYLSACTMGLPTDATLTALRADLDDWSHARTGPARYGDVVETTRTAYAALVGVPVDHVAIGSQTSAMVSVLAAAVPPGREVLCVDGDFSSVVYPFLAAADRGVRVRHVPLDRLAASITADTHLVSFSLVQSATGAVADVDAIVTAARHHGSRTLCDTTQAAGAMPVDASVFDATVCHAYKWLCAPRGVAFLTLGDEYRSSLVPLQAGWYAGDDVWGSCYGPRMDLATDARAFDVSPAWQAWVGAAPAVDLFARTDLAALHHRSTSLGDALCDGLGIPRLGQAIITWPDADGQDLAALADAGVVASGRAGRARVAFHLWNDEDDVERVLTALRPGMARPRRP
ncbi:aminotransferase class V-fold PLP-dependent enzyme [Sanguibacter suaedae]|uniref:Aminotransferase class V-fold PLP-dependent enzyme n=1 Tax=Sanguibacter suaedae TaxID=2795737 RepID=A0A934M7E0_9MICO|nr:aminotransferase class V-fold PLP-dependent enzyme [Sanguibacter suaedae]MBI9115302.1 aminotransferase class V-fold PLP-dependent enzyme [Sanguibacter suaedae]